MAQKYISVWEVIEKLYRDYDHQEELDHWDIIEWAAEALQYIGAGIQYNRYVAEIVVSNNISTLPCNYHDQPILSLNGHPMVYASGAFAPMQLGTQTIEPSSGTTGSSITNNDSPTNINQGNTRIKGFEVNDDKYPRSGDVSLNTNRLRESFYIQDNVLVTSFTSGTVIMEYRGIPVDKEGYPKIPDNNSCKAAVSAYCQYMMDRRDWRRKRVTKDIFYESQREWEYKCAQARGSLNMPDINQMENFKNQWVKLKPNMNSANSFWNDLSIREMKKHR
jgi:hypothetical protein